MAPVSPERFGTLFRSLASPARTAFIARLWAARGWQTTVDGADVVATRDDATRRIRVVDPGRFGTPSLDDVDVLVTARDRNAVRDAAAAGNVAYLPPETVRAQLLYGVDRETAATLFAETFEAPLAAATGTTPPLSRRVQGVGTATLGAVRERVGGSRQLSLLLVIALLVGVAVAGPALSPTGESDVTVPQATYTAGEAGALGESTTTATSSTATAAATAVDDDSRLDGLGERRITDRKDLLDGHVDAVLRTPRTLTVRASGPPNATLMNGRKTWRYTSRIESPRQYLFDGRFVFPPSRFPPTNETTVDIVDVSIYADGSSKYRKQVDPTETSYREYAIDTTGDASGFAREVRSYFETFLKGNRSIVDCAGTLESGECVAYRIVITGAPQTFPDADSYRAVAVVQDDGLISSLEVSYTLPDRDGDGHREPVYVSVEYEALGETSVSTPDWVSAAKNETSN
jgi:hypothetical protein